MLSSTGSESNTFAGGSSNGTSILYDLHMLARYRRVRGFGVKFSSLYFSNTFNALSKSFTLTYIFKIKQRILSVHATTFLTNVDECPHISYLFVFNPFIQLIMYVNHFSCRIQCWTL